LVEAKEGRFTSFGGLLRMTSPNIHSPNDDVSPPSQENDLPFVFHYNATHRFVLSSISMCFAHNSRTKKPHQRYFDWSSNWLQDGPSSEDESFKLEHRSGDSVRLDIPFFSLSLRFFLRTTCVTCRLVDQKEKMIQLGYAIEPEQDTLLAGFQSNSWKV
jgi:hypothetical protein